MSLTPLTRPPRVRRALAIAAIASLAWTASAHAKEDPGSDAPNDAPNRETPAKPSANQKAKENGTLVRPTVELLEALKSKSPDEVVGAANEAAEVQDHELLRPLTKLLSHKDRLVRMASIGALKTRQEKADRKKAAASLGLQLNKRSGPDNLKERMAIVDALHYLAEPSTMKVLIGGIDRESDRNELKARLMAVANVPSKDAIELLIKFMDAGNRRGRPGHRGAADAALQYATGAGNVRKQWDRTKGRGGENAWRDWWREHKKTFDPKAVAAAREQARREAEAREAEKQERQRKKKERKARKRNKKGKKRADEPQGEEA